MKVGVIANSSKPGAAALLSQLHHVCDVAHAEFLLEAETAALIGQRGLALSTLLRRVDVLLAAGGDGSLLRLVHRIHPSKVPVLGINIGRLGFLTAITREEILDVMVDLLTGRQKLRFSPRAVLRGVAKTKTGSFQIPCALNDVVVFRGNSSHMVRLRVFLDDILVNEYVADGLIVSTPTGSTAYAMAAGGPIIDPETRAFYLTPICPHSLSNRGLVFAQSSVVRMEIPPKAPAVTLQYDGCESCRLHPGDSLQLRLAEHHVMLAFLAQRDFYQIVRQKLRWSGASV